MAKKSHLDDLPHVHPRRAMLDAAKLELLQFQIELEKRHPLSAAELILIFADRASAIADQCRKQEWSKKKSYEPT